MNQPSTIEDLERQIEALKRRVAELEGPARRYQALFDGGVVSLQILDPESRTLEVSPGFQRIWRLSLEDVADYVMLSDPQLAENGSLNRVEEAFRGGLPRQLPTIRYDPVETHTVGTGTAGWVTAALHPVKDAAGGVLEVVMIHMDVGELKDREEELRRSNKELAAAVAERGAEVASEPDGGPPDRVRFMLRERPAAIRIIRPTESHEDLQCLVESGKLLGCCDEPLWAKSRSIVLP